MADAGTGVQPKDALASPSLLRHLYDAGYPASALDKLSSEEVAALYDLDLGRQHVRAL